MEIAALEMATNRWLSALSDNYPQSPIKTEEVLLPVATLRPKQ